MSDTNSESSSGHCSIAGAAAQLPDAQAFLDAAPDPLVIVDPSGRIAFVNIEAQAMFEYSRGDLVGQPVEVLLPERYRERHRKHSMSYFVAPRRRAMGAGIELVARRKDGAEFPVEISLSPVRTAQGIFVSSAIRDVTQRKAVERGLIEARSLAEQAHRAKSAALAAASHDLRQPLQTLTLLSSVLSRAVPTESSAAAVVANQSETLRLMAELLNSLLDIGKLEAGAVKPVMAECSVGDLFTRLHSAFAPLAEAKGLDLIAEDCDHVVRTDPALLSEIIQNLIGNAIRYTQRGSVRLRAVSTETTVRIEVLDTGVGIPSEELDSIFAEYYQAARKPGEAREGAGLGLAIAHRVADLLGCSLDVASIVGRGSCFTVSVPRAQAAASPKARFLGSRQSPAAEEGLVLVVDDDAAVAEATALLLSAAGLEAIVARNASQALVKLEEHGRTPSILVCDYHLGRAENGVDAIRTLREATGLRLPAILVSGDTSSSLAASSMNVGDCHLLSKPVDADELLEVLAYLVHRDRQTARRQDSRDSGAVCTPL